MKNEILIYDNKNIYDLRIDDRVNYNIDRKWILYLINIIKEPSDKFCGNFNGEIFIIKVNNVIIPCAKIDSSFNNSNISSISKYYIDFGLDTLREKLKKTFFLISNLVLILKKLFFLKDIDKGIYINFWFFPTPLKTIITKNQYLLICNLLQKEFPYHAHIFRGFNNYFEIENFIQKNEGKIISKIFYKIESIKIILKKNHVKNTLKEYRNTEYTIYDDPILTTNEINEIFNLYNELYINKHSIHSVKYTKHWFQYVLANNLVNLDIVTSDNIIKAFSFTIEDFDYLISSIEAFDLKSADSQKLYTLNFANRLNRSIKTNKKLNLSSGGDKFKKNRGGNVFFEFDIIIYKHINIIPKIKWSIFIFFYKVFGERIYKKLIQ